MEFKKYSIYSPMVLHAGELAIDERPYGGVIKFGLPGEHLGRFSCARAIFRPDSKTEGHYHLVSEEAYFVEQGSARITLRKYNTPDTKMTYEIMAGDYLTIPVGYVHYVAVTSLQDFVILVIASPPFSFWDQFFPNHNLV